MAYENLENVRAENRDGVLVVTVDRPKVLNALNEQTVNEIERVFLEARATSCASCGRSSTA